MKQDQYFPFEDPQNLTPDRVANLLIPLMASIYGKQQIATLKGEPMSLSEAFRSVVNDISFLSKELTQLEQEVRQKQGS